MSDTQAAYAEHERRAIDTLARRGIGVAPRPRSPQPHELVTDRGVIAWPDAFDNRVSDDLLNRWHLSLAAWLAYAHSMLGVAEAVRAQAEDTKAAARAKALAAADGSITDRRALADADPDTLAAGAVAAQAKATAALVKGRVDGIQARLMAVAQEVKRRTEAVGPRHAGPDGRRG